MPLARVETPRGLAAALRSAGQAFCAVAPLEYLQTVGAFSLVLGAHLAFLQDGLADFGPEVTGATEAFGTI